MTKKGFIFDLDGVIVDTAKYHYKAWKVLADQLGFKFTLKHNELLKGVSRKRSLDILLSIGNIVASQDQKEYWMAAKNEDYLTYIRKMTNAEILPDVPKVLDFLKTNEHPIALGSASKNANEILTRVGLRQDFDALVDGTHVSKAKPDPEVFLLGAQLLNKKPEQCVVFEDAVAGIEAAKNAGMTAIGIGDEFTLRKADYVFKNFTEISTEFIAQL
ncbi:beta-phosphoglucomutase [Aquimarina agarilytica]|uniref:beta-phosphoglucomutase n=1 Tax=Aquimarina agarilytica TaxID=1087449 RepID=UPI000288C4C9|nr:beta-phosphoglucomutase [Aquimarina agarilytica]